MLNGNQFHGVSPRTADEGEDSVAVFWTNTPEVGDFALEDVLFPATQKLKPDPEWVREKTEESSLNFELENEAVEMDYDFASAMASLAAKLILLLQARPEMIERSQFVRRSLKHGGVQVWSPNFVGRDYTFAKNPEGTTLPLDKTGKIAALRFRRGHYRRQPCGTGRHEHKIIWIEPFLTTVWCNAASTMNAA
ncbi:MAG: hypothetical protein ACR2JB_04005 [Bryobacteraceae bacterium]